MRKSGLLIKSSRFNKINSDRVLYILGLAVEKNETNKPVNNETNILVGKKNGLVHIITSEDIFSNVDNYADIENRTNGIFDIDTNAQIINYSISTSTNFYFFKYYNSEKILRSFCGMDQINPSEYGDFISKYENGLISNKKVVDDIVCYYDEIYNEYVSHDSFCDERVSKSILEYFDFEIMGVSDIQYEYYTVLKEIDLSHIKDLLNPKDLSKLKELTVVQDEIEVLFENNDECILIGKVGDKVWNRVERFDNLLVDKEKYVFGFNKIIKPLLLKWGFEYNLEGNFYYRIINSFKQSISFFDFIQDTNKDHLIKTNIVAQIAPINYYDWYVENIDKESVLTEKEIDRMSRCDYEPFTFNAPATFANNTFVNNESISYEDYMKVISKIFIDMIYFFKQRDSLGSFLGHSNCKIVTTDLLLMNNLKYEAKKEFQQYSKSVLKEWMTREAKQIKFDEVNKRIKLFFPELELLKFKDD